MLDYVRLMNFLSSSYYCLLQCCVLLDVLQSGCIGWTSLSGSRFSSSNSPLMPLGQDFQYLVDCCKSTLNVATSSRSKLPTEHHRPTSFLCGWSVSVECFARVLARFWCWHRQIQTAFENICSLRTSTYSALEVLRLCAI